MDVRMLNRKEVCSILGTSSAGLHRGMKKGLYPQPYRIGENSVRWKSNEIQAVIDNLQTAAPVPVAPGCSRRGRKPRTASVVEVQS